MIHSLFSQVILQVNVVFVAFPQVDVPPIPKVDFLQVIFRKVFFVRAMLLRAFFLVCDIFAGRCFFNASMNVQ